jgi:hypothetical protein
MDPPPSGEGQLLNQFLLRLDNVAAAWLPAIEPLNREGVPESNNPRRYAVRHGGIQHPDSLAGIINGHSSAARRGGASGMVNAQASGAYRLSRVPNFELVKKFSERKFAIEKLIHRRLHDFAEADVHRSKRRLRISIRKRHYGLSHIDSFTGIGRGVPLSHFLELSGNAASRLFHLAIPAKTVEFLIGHLRFASRVETFHRSSPGCA